jgi:hypothetical protein
VTLGIPPAHGAAAVGEYTEPQRGVDDDRDNSAWAHLLADAVVQRVPVEALPALLAAEAQPGAHAPDAETPATTLAAGGSGRGAVAPSEGDTPIERVATEVEVSGLGKVAVSVTREASGLSIVIGVADAHVKALIEAERAALVQALKVSGLSIARVEVWGNGAIGTALAQDPRGNRSMSSRAANPKVRAYRTSQAEEPTDTARNVDVTA